MRFVRSWMVGGFLSVLASLHAAAPDEIGGKIFREKTNFPAAHTPGERTTILDRAGTTHCVYNAANPLQGEAGLAMLDPFGDGTFIYTRTGESTATLDFQNAAAGSLRIYKLNFTSDTTGTISLLTDIGGSFEISDENALQTVPLSNSSLRGRVAPGQSLIAGFVVPGSRTREILIRVAGPALTALGVAGAWADPDFQIYSGNVPAVRAEVHYGDWSKSTGRSIPRAGFEKIFAYLGAFPFADGSKDAAEMVRLPPGAYTIVASAGASDPGGEALIEIYLMP